jgi:hypothetical protein
LLTIGTPAFPIPLPAIVLGVGIGDLLKDIAIVLQSEDFLTAIAAKGFGQNDRINLTPAAGARITLVQIDFLLIENMHGCVGSKANSCMIGKSFNCGQDFLGFFSSP